MTFNAENNKDAQHQKVKVKAEPMEVDPPAAELPSPASHLLPFSTLGASEEKEPMNNQPDALACPQKDLFSQDISVKMASELLFKLSGKRGSSSVLYMHLYSYKFFLPTCSSAARETLEVFFLFYLHFLIPSIKKTCFH